MLGVEGCSSRFGRKSGPVDRWVVDYSVSHVNAPSPLPEAPMPPLGAGRTPSGHAISEADEELLALPAPPRRAKRIAIAILFASTCASLAFAWTLRHDARYAFVSDSARDVGDLAAWSGNDGGFVLARGNVSAARAIRYDRALTEGSFRLCPVWANGERAPVWVEVRLPEGVDAARFIPPDSFEGRLVRFGEAGPRYRGIADAVRRQTGAKIDPGAWLMIDEGGPSTSRWAPALCAVMIAFALWNVAILIRLTRRVA